MASLVSSSYRFLGNGHHTVELWPRTDSRIFTWLEPVS
ncbi:hypothetical protein ISN44_As06g028800 [Arabidopsis suecica]|uniref:Uncharacterized protein n=1 Tax=Arabidopsis suecica TaxID=45249 RepID=A0A8T2CK84_ARASU|nr:hypothetical protein ISN44_As06g028800 [Arabidopsis suecica]